MDNTEVVKDILTHHGVKGMRWGVRRGEGTATAVSVTQKGKKLKGSGGANHPAHPDAIAAKTVSQKLKKSGVNSLSNEELQKLSTRANLEAQVGRVSSTHTARLAKGNSAVGEILKSGGHLNSAVALANSPAGRVIRKGAKVAAVAA